MHMRTLRFVCVLALASVLASCGRVERTVPIDIAFKLVDDQNVPVPGASLRIVAGVPDWDADGWRGPDAGVRIVTGADGTARFKTDGVVDRRWRWEPVGFTPIRVPVRVDHLGVGFEVARVLPTRHGDVTKHWFYTTEIWRYVDGTSGTFDMDRVYEAGSDGRFTKLLAKSVSSPDSVIMIDGLALSGSGYRLADFTLGPAADAKTWSLRIVLMQMPKPVMR
jgi:hypothetical protein